MAAATGTATVDFGSTPVDQATFVITDAAFASFTYIEAFVMGSDTTGDNDADAHQQLGYRARWTCTAANGAGQFSVEAEVTIGFVTGQFKLRYVGST